MKNRKEIEQEIIKKAVEDDEFRKQLRENPKATIAGFLPEGTDIPDEISINVIEESPTSLTLVLPPLHTSELNEEELDSVSAGGYWDIKHRDTSEDGCILM